MSHRQQLIALVIQRIQELATDKGQDVGEVRESTNLLDGEAGIDSLDLATIVIELQQSTGTDPFSNGFLSFNTVGELVDLYVA